MTQLHNGDIKLVEEVIELVFKEVNLSSRPFILEKQATYTTAVFNLLTCWKQRDKNSEWLYQTYKSTLEVLKESDTDKYFFARKWLSKIFRYLDRYYIPEHNLTPLEKI